VTEGRLTLEIQGKSVPLSNTAYLFESNHPHVFANQGRKAVRFFRSTIW